MGCPVEATLICSDVVSGRQGLYRAFREIERIDHLVGPNEDQSEIEKINRHAGGSPVRVSPETLALLERATQYTRRFGGLFDVSIGPLMHLWGFNDEETESVHQVPERAKVDSLRRLIGANRLVLSRADTTAFLPEPGMRIDLGGIAKGYAVDQAVTVLRAQGFSDFLINAGGDVYVSGRNQDGTSWRVGIRHPRRKEDLIATLECTDGAVATSGDYERFFEIDGTRYHHIIDPRTGYPATASRSATVLARTAEEADALATALFIRGAGDQSADPSGDLPGGPSGDQLRDQSGDPPGVPSEELSGGQSGDPPGGQSGGQPGDQSRDPSGDGSGDDEIGPTRIERYILVDAQGTVTCDSVLFRSHHLKILD
jgi:thiamine biosynthesis lipoprotein